MPLREDILAPIPGDNPAGQDLRYQPVYDKIKEARREDDELAQGAWQHERKLADHNLAIKLAQEAIAKQSKDLQLAAWLTDSMLRRDGYGGLLEGLVLCRDLIGAFWENLYPQLDDGDAEFRAAPLEFIANKLDFPLKKVSLTRDGHDFYVYKDSRAVGYEDQAKAKDDKTRRDAAIKSGKIPPEVFDKSFFETPKAFYATGEKNLDGCLKEIAALDEVCQAKFGDVAPSFGRIRGAAEEVRYVVHGLLQKRRETDPDPVAEAPPAAEPEKAPVSADSGPQAASAPAVARSPVATTLTIQAPEEPAGRKEAIDAVVATAAFLRRREPSSPAPYLMLRGLRWGELRRAIQSNDAAQLEGPPGELRRAIKQLALNRKWNDLIETAENAMALPCSRGWLDLQRFVVDACVALGTEYQLIAIAIRSEIRALIRDVPEIFDLSLMDDTPAANPETQTWLRQLAEEPQAATPRPFITQPAQLDGDSAAGWQQKFVDSYAMALQAVRSGQEQKGFELLHNEIQRQRSGRARFDKRIQFVQLCASTGKDALAQPMLDDLLAAVETHKLEEWEDREKLAAALAVILSASKKLQGDAKEKQKMFERICRLNPVQALSIG